MGVADQSRISMAGSTDNTPTNNNDASIGTEETKQKKEKKWILVKAKCLHCKQNYAANTTRNGTSGVRQHLTNRCKVYKPPPVAPDIQKLLNIQRKVFRHGSLETAEGIAEKGIHGGDLWTVNPSKVRRL
ncbi:hypothetical protein KY284_022256 [Solanum tuberosum]|nr:hypothetical protein KY284_022256 [Solanum tuberosum]